MLNDSFVLVDVNPTLERFSGLLTNEASVSYASSQDNISTCNYPGFKFSLSGSDLGIGISHQLTIDHKLNTPSIYPVSALFNKIELHRAIMQISPELAFEDVQIYSNPKRLIKDLNQQQNIKMIRSELNSKRAQAIKFYPQNEMLVTEVEKMFDYAKNVMVHSFQPGNVFFLNAIVCNGILKVNDVWQCFFVETLERDMLTSVINVDPDLFASDQKYASLLKLPVAMGIDNGPIHFEFLDTGEQLKVIKMVPRFASEPLPTLCDRLNIQNQITAFYQSLYGKANLNSQISSDSTFFVADYSFICYRAGILKNIFMWDMICRLPSFDGVHTIPTIGEPVAKTNCGDSYTATIFLKNRHRAQLLKDIYACQEYNRQGIFDII